MRDGFHGQVGLFQQGPGGGDPPVQQPASGADPQLVGEAPGQRAGRHPGAERHLGDADRLVQPSAQPLQQRGQRVRHRSGGGQFGVLQLAALAVRGHHHLAGDPHRVRGSLVGAYQVQAEVDAGRRSGAGRDVAVVHVQHGGVDPDPREPGGQFRGLGPVGGGPPLVQQSGCGEHEGARADADDPRAATVCPPDRGDQRGRHLGSGGLLPARDQYRVRALQGVQARRHQEVVSGLGPYRAGVLGTDLERVAGGDGRAVVGEHLGRAGQREGRLRGPQHGHDPVERGGLRQRTRRHGAKVPHHVVQDTGARGLV